MSRRAHQRTAHRQGGTGLPLGPAHSRPGALGRDARHYSPRRSRRFDDGFLPHQFDPHHVEATFDKLRQEFQNEVQERERAQAQSYVASIGLAQRSLQEERPAAPPSCLEHCPAQLRHWEWHYLWRQCAQASQPVSPSSSEPTLAPAVSELGKRLAVLDGKLIKVQRPGKPMDPIVLDGHTGNVTSITFSRDGQRLASIAGDQTVRVWNANTGQELLVFPTSVTGTITFSLDGNRLMLVHPVSREVLKQWDGTAGR